MKNIILTALAALTATPALADCLQTAEEAAVYVSKLPLLEGERKFVSVLAAPIISRDIGTDTYSVEVALSGGERRTYNVSLNRRTCEPSSVVRKF